MFFDNGGFDTTKSTYACNRASQGEVCKPLLDTVEGYNVKKLSAYACSGNTKLNTSTCGMRYLKSRGEVPLQEIIERHNVSVTEDDLYKCFYGNEKSTECDSMKRFGSKYYNYVHYLCNTPMLSQYPTFFNYYTNFLTNVSESLHFNESKKLIVSDDGIRMEKLQSQQQEPFKRIHYGASPRSCKFPAGPQCPSYDAKLRTVFTAKNMYHDSRNALTQPVFAPMVRMPILTEDNRIMCKAMFPQGAAEGQYIDAKQRNHDLLHPDCSTGHLPRTSIISTKKTREIVPGGIKGMRGRGGKSTFYCSTQEQRPAGLPGQNVRVWKGQLPRLFPADRSVPFAIRRRQPRVPKRRRVRKHVL